MSGSKLIELFRQQARAQLPSGIELATVISGAPALKIRIDNMPVILEGDDLVVCAHLLEHQLTYSTAPAVADSEVSTVDGHTHDVTGLTINGQAATIGASLQAGDRVAVMALPGGQQYLVWDKVVIMGG